MKKECICLAIAGQLNFTQKDKPIADCQICGGKGYVENEWEKEFEDEIKLFCGMDGIEFVNSSIEETFSKFIGKLPTAEGSNKYKVKIRACKGVILIERVK